MDTRRHTLQRWATLPVRGPRDQGPRFPRGRNRVAGPIRSRAGWLWGLAWAALTVAVGLAVRLPGPATLDPDEHAAVLYFDRLVAGDRLEDPLLSSPKPLLTVVHGLAWHAAGDWRLLEVVAVAAFALAVVCLARAAARLGGPAAAAATVVAVAGSGPLVLQAARGNSLVFALAGWSVALDALTGGGPGDPGAGGGRDRGGSGAAWGVAAAALTAAGLARAETWLLLPVAAGFGVAAWRRGQRRGLWLLLPLAAPLLWLAHDWLLTGDPLYGIRVPGRYTDLVSGRQMVPPGEWGSLVARRYGAEPVLLGLAAAGAIWLVRRRAWAWVAGLGVMGIGVLALLGVQAWQGTYISWRYFDPADVALRLTAAFGAVAVAGVVGNRLGGGGGRAARLAGVGAGRPDRGRWAGLAAAVGAVLLVAVACWPLAPADPLFDSTLDRDRRLSANTATAIDVLRPVAAPPGTVITASGPQRVRVAVELGLPLDRVRDLFLAGLTSPLDRALAGSTAVFHDADGDRPTERFAPLSATAPTRVGGVEVVPMRTDPGRGLYVHRVRAAGGKR